MKDAVYVPGLNKNLFSISALDVKGMRFLFFYGQIRMCPKGKTIDDATMIGEEEGGLHKLKGKHEQALVHESIEPSELWNRRLVHVHYRALLIVRKAVSRLPEI